MDLTITGKRCKIHYDEMAVQSLSKGNHLMDLRDGVSSNINNDDDEIMSTNSVARHQPLLVERHDVRNLLDPLSLEQLCPRRLRHSLDTDRDQTSSLVSSSGQMPRRTEEEEGTEEEVADRNYKRFGSLPEYLSCFSGVDDNRDGDDKGEDANESAEETKETLSSAANDDAQVEEETFVLSEEQLKEYPSGIVLVS